MGFEIPADFHDVNRDKTDPVEPNTFELGLALAGTVSAGAYTAGFIDFLIEALDEYQRHGLGGGQQPHRVKLRVISGTSGGAIVAAQAGRALYRRFQPMAHGGTEKAGRQNIFYDTWVNRIDIGTLLEMADLDEVEDFAGVASLLNTGGIDRLAAANLAYMPGEESFAPRDWVGDPLDIIFTEFNLRGIPYRVPYAEIGGRARHQSFMDHADHVRFQLLRPDGGAKARPDALAIDPATTPYCRTFGEAALGSAAFPVALRARTIARPLRHYLYRGQRNTREETAPDGTGVIYRDIFAPLDLDGEVLAQGRFTNPAQTYAYVAVDGGVANTEPVELARTTLAGVLGRNPRTALDANRAVVLVAPLFSPQSMPAGPPPDRNTGAQAADILAALVPAMRRQALFSTAALQLAGDADIYSRFMVLPSRPWPNTGDPVTIGHQAIAGAGLSGFLGFLDRRYRHHDFRLGRHNAWLFLKTEFLLDAENAVFTGWKAASLKAERATHAVTHKGRDFLPIVPLVGTAAAEPEMPDWPQGGIADRDRTERAMRRRIERLADLLPLEGGKGGGVFSAAWWYIKAGYLEPLEEAMESRAMDKIRSAIDACLADKKLA
ncbi:MAG: patatin-like phospholipase family protein [Rhodospirillaceae bacterium]|nr:patatin-like phospholipase family protein [Rhodospirillaceae bacterium]